MDLLIRNIGKIFDGRKIINEKEIYIENGKIKKIGGKERAEEVIDADGNLVMPGFIDSHTHIAFAGYRDFEINWKVEGASYMEISKRGGGILYTVRETKKATKERIKKEMMERARDMFHHGTTTIEVKSGYGLDRENEIKLLEAINEMDAEATIVPTFLAHAIPEEMNEEEYTDYVIDEIIPEVGERKLARFADVFCEEGYFSVTSSERILRAAMQHGMTPKIHADEFSCCGCSRLAALLKAASADHLLETGEEEMKLLASNNVVATLLPATPFVLNEKYADAVKMIENGVDIAIATDMNPNCYVSNMQFIIQLAVYRMRIPVITALKAATLNGAKALGIDDMKGSIEVGKDADILITSVKTPEFIPYHVGSNLIDVVVKDGVPYYLKQ
ncbi:MAG: imidazolonepropionase [Thermoplasmata archaeon]|nr:imidazolonepropionase [Thermoplasmata archaeon]